MAEALERAKVPEPPRPRRLGPGLLVAAAFVGPGTVTMCTVAGAQYGTKLLWVLAFATITSLLLQDMAVRLGVGARLGLGEALLGVSGSGVLRGLVTVMVMAALFVGNAAYEAGNLAGAALGVEAALGNEAPPSSWVVLGLGMFGAIVLGFGSFELSKNLLVGLVLIMSLLFTWAAFVSAPDVGALIDGLWPRLPQKGGLTPVLGLLGTTVVPYNLFMHAATARRHWSKPDAIRVARWDSAGAVLLGGLVSAAILITASEVLFSTGVSLSNGRDLAKALEPTAGPWARVVVGFGLFAAGLTSALTAPLAARLVADELFAGTRHRGLLSQGIALSILAVGTGAGAAQFNPVHLIVVAQAANGVLLPVAASLLLVVVNQRARMGGLANTWMMNLVGGAAVAVTGVLGLRLVLSAAGFLP